MPFNGFTYCLKKVLQKLTKPNKYFKKTSMAAVYIRAAAE